MNSIPIKHKRWIQTLFILFLLADLSFSFVQHYNTPLYGDLENGILPDKDVRSIFDDPFGFEKIITGEKGVNPNRFFSHYFFSEYFKNVPLWLQHFVSPISSAYLSCAIIKVIVQVFFIFFLSAFISGKTKIFSREFITAAVIITPLFQVYGYWSRMGIIDQSIAYNFFYSIPIVALMLFLSPVFNHVIRNKKIRNTAYLYLVPLIIILPFSGPLIPALIVIITFLVLIYYWRQSGVGSYLKKVPSVMYIVLIPASLWSLYSLVLGFYDSNYQSETIPVLARFLKLPEGIFSQLFHSLGIPLLLTTIAINIFLIRKLNPQESVKFINVFKWIGVFAFIYIILLPFGGYRPYRARIIRYDTILPVTVALMFYFGATTYYLINNLKERRKARYYTFIVLVLAIFTFSDTKGIGKNRCERMALKKIATSQDSVVAISNNCYVMSWSNNFDYKKSDKKAELLYYWRITKTKKLFYNEQ
ncbi:hypothetical protein SAMN05444274_103138 [Mariniphaga anaerophila]|uniref:Dolichyl-phosphate-mannose-protein mannosyltransferase n=1 Tax=Mariniphaga anaerophila TaxID=1484053 RepID=A0A1M4XVJ3_9BACT|nr:hypothetical protein [Mariniphaga anaerophila]SHE97499.1 hypothetical protein SAMN05444274_103138 [Mariniphaga anaerophila]